MLLEITKLNPGKIDILSLSNKTYQEFNWTIDQNLLL